MSRPHPSIYHLTTPDAWEAARAAGAYTAPSLASEGFIHASTPAQVEGSANRFFEGQPTLLALELDPGRLRSELRWDLSSHSADPFPHVYGPIDLDAVVAVVAWDRGDDGRFRWPPAGRP